MVLNAYIVTTKPWLIDSLKEWCQHLELNINFRVGNIDELNFNVDNTLFFIDHVFISHELIDVNNLKYCKWVLLTDRVLVYHKALLFPPIDFINIDLPTSEIYQKLNLINAKYNSDSKYLPANNVIQLTDIKRNLIYQNVNLLVYAEGLGDYARLYTLDKERVDDTSVRQINIAHNLKYLTDTLNDNDFFRVHRSYIVNLNYLEPQKSIKESKVILKCGKEIPIARRRKKELFNSLESFNIGK